jgi:hypothetical protein
MGIWEEKERKTRKNNFTKLEGQNWEMKTMGVEVEHCWIYKGKNTLYSEKC